MHRSRLTHCAMWLAVSLSILAAGARRSATRPKSGILRYEFQALRDGRSIFKHPHTIWFKGDRYRVESFGPTEAPPDAGIGMDRTVEIYSPGVQFSKLVGYRTLWRKTRWNPPFKDGILVTFGPDALSVAQMRQQKRIGSETVGGHPAAIYERETTHLQDARFRRKGQREFERYWLRRDFPVPVKFAYRSMLDGTLIGQGIYTLKSAEFNVSLADSLFQPPKDANVHDLIPPKQP